MSTTKKYDAILTMQLTQRCNMDCEYCFDSTEQKRNSPLEPINIEALMNTLDSTNKRFRLNFAGGEIFLIPNIIEACKELTKKHVVFFNSNLIPSTVMKFADEIDPDRVFEIHASLHIKELEKRNLTEKFINHYTTLKEKGFKMSSVAVAHPALEPEVEKYIEFFTSKGIDFTFGHFIGKYNGKEYPKSYTAKDLAVFNMEGEDDDVSIYYRKGKICNAGTNLFLSYTSGKVYPCYAVQKELGHVYDGFKELQEPLLCTAEMCSCPPEFLDIELHKSVVNS